MKVSALIICFNEEKNIRECIGSVQGLADEIIVVDSYSTDRTLEICMDLKVRVIQRVYKTQIEQKQYALSLASHPVIISIDADEKLSDQLKTSILFEKSKGFPYDGYEFNRKAFYCGRWIKFGDWGSEWKIRLWKKESALWQGANPHDKVILKGQSRSKKLRGDLFHYTFETEEEHKEQAGNYAQISADSYTGRGIYFPMIKRWLSPAFYFLKSFILKRGFLDGKLGWQIARITIFEKYQKYKLYAKHKYH